MSQIAKLRSLPDVVDEYEAKAKAIPDMMAAFEAAGTALRIGATIGGEHGGQTIDTSGRGTDQRTLEKNLLCSAWSHVWNGLNLPGIASARDKKAWEQALANPPPFTLDNLRATFGPYLENPRRTILRGLAEVFADLDPAYKSHEKVKIGVKGLPKRAVLNYVYSEHGTVRGDAENRVRDITNALAAYRGEPLADWQEIRNSLNEAKRHGEADWRGGTVKAFQNGNCHLFFGPDALRDINLALAEFYGDVLPDCPDWEDGERPARRASTEVARDLQFYPTPKNVIDTVLADLNLTGARVLEPSCGDGRIMDALREKGASVIGVEVDASRHQLCQAKGHICCLANFLELTPDLGGWGNFDYVVMNPPFYGKHYARHVRHALRFLKPGGGKLVAILPATARYDHGLLDDLNPSWRDLPVGAFAESGTNVCTTVATINARAA